MKNTSNTHDFSEVLTIVRHVRRMLFPSYGNIEGTQKQAGKKFELVTQLDIDVERFLKRELAKAYPDIAFVGEECGGDRSAKRFWLVDPIDGTACFIRGLPFCTSQLALIENNEVLFSAIYDFVNDVMYSAVKGRGTFANGKRLRVSNRPLQGSHFVWETHLDKEANMRWFLRLRKESVLWHFGAAGFDLMLVASGKLEGRICIDAHGKDYDFAAGSLLVQEAGGIVANIGMRSYDYRNLNFIAANPVVFHELTDGPDAIFPLQDR
jgi:myo-inositol-1(or 4)-monophosphatase